MDKKHMIKILHFTLIPFFVVCAMFLQMRYDVIIQERFDLQAPVHRSVTPAPVIRHFTFGFQNALADYYWITAVQALNKWDRRDVYFPEYFRIIATLDPKFVYPYFFAVLIIPNTHNPESLSVASGIAEVGMKALPENWEIPFYLAMQYRIIGKSDERTLHYLNIAAEKSSSPEYVHTTLAIHLMKDSSAYERSRSLFMTIYETSDNAQTKQIVKERIALLDLIESLERATSSYKLTRGSYPGSMQDLVRAGLIRLPPELVNKFHIQIDKNTGIVTVR